MEQYTPSQVSCFLRDTQLETEDLDLYLDIQSGLEKLPLKNRLLLRIYALDISPQEAVQSQGWKDNPQRLFDASIRRLTGILNGKENTEMGRKGKV